MDARDLHEWFCWRGRFAVPVWSVNTEGVAWMGEHRDDREAYAVFAGRMGWSATWEQLGPTARSAFSATFARVRAGQSRPDQRPDRASGAEVLAHLRRRGIAH